MSRLLKNLLAPYCAPAGDDGSDTSGTGAPAPAPAAAPAAAPAVDDDTADEPLEGAPSAELLEDLGISQAEFDALPEAQRASLLTSIDNEDAIPNKEAKFVSANSDASDPDSADTTTQQPAKAPAAAPAAPKPAGDGVDPAAAPAAAAPAPAATPEPGKWRAVTAADPLPVEGLEEARAPKQIATEADKTAKVQLKGQLQDLFDKFAEGEITKEEYNAQKAPIEDQLDTIQGRVSAQLALDSQYQQTIDDNWKKMVDTAMGAAKGAGLDFMDPANKAKAEELDATVRQFAQAAALIHADKPAVWRDKWALAEGMQKVAARHGVELTFGAAPAPGAAPAAAPKAPAKPGPRAAPDLSTVPPTLRQAPPAASANVNADEFAHIDSLTPAEAEKAIAKFTPEQLERYTDR